MFNFISLRNRLWRNESFQPSLPPTDLAVTVTIWHTGSGITENDTSVGHAAIELPETKFHKKQYFSLRPKYKGTVNPFTTLLGVPVQAHVASPKEDVELEGKSPDRAIEVRLSEQQINAMHEEATKYSEQIACGSMLYSLMPRYSALWLSLFKSKSTVSHCSDSVTKILASGGISSNVSKICPWVITPTQVAQNLETCTNRSNLNRL